MDYHVEFIEDNDVFDMLSDNSFMASWKALSLRDEKVTVIQEPEFVCTWYRVYRNQYSPLLCIGLDEESKLVGLMPLSVHRLEKYIVHAGDSQAEYHGWIADNKIDNEFPVEVIIKLKKKFNIKSWKWRPLPPGAPIGWLNSKKFKKENIYFIAKHRSTAILDLHDKKKINKTLKNKSIRTKLNRFKKRGKFYIERVRSKERAEKLLDVVADQCDFRHHILYDRTVFRSDPNKKKFYTEKLNYADSNHFTVLWVNDKPIAFHHGDCDSDTVYIGLSSFCPLELKNSPGILLIIKLVELLEQEGFRYLDFTPGGDDYKKRFANLYREVVMPHFFFSRHEKIKFLFNLLYSKVRQKILDITDKSFNIYKLNMLPRKEYLFFQLQEEDFIRQGSNKNEENININNYIDLICVERQHLPGDIFDKINKKYQFYTLCKNKHGCHVVWVSNNNKSIVNKQMNVEFSVNHPSSFLSDFFINPTISMSLFEQLIQKIIIDSFDQGDRSVYVYCSGEDVAMKKMLDKFGFKADEKIDAS